MRHTTLSVFNMNRTKQCDLYDSQSNPEGQATGVAITRELTGWKEISFTLPRLVNGEVNHRWDYIKGDHLLRLTVGTEMDWFVIQEPKKTHSGIIASTVVKCPHISSQLNKRNLYVEFDDENGIGTASEQMNRALAGTGWSLGLCDTFFERDGKTEKVRTQKASSKRGAYQQVQDICKLFNAYPMFHGDARTVDIHALGKRDALLELNYGKNIKTLERAENTENIVTRLYVEGEYGDQGYVGIDDINPTGLPFLLDFSYYIRLGTFTADHQAAVDQYLLDIRRERATAGEITGVTSSLEDKLNQLWGQYNYVLYVMDAGAIIRTLVGGTVALEKQALLEGDALCVLKTGGTHEYSLYTGAPFPSDVDYVIKRVTKPSGLIGGKEVGIEAKEQSILSLEKLRDKTTSAERRDEYQRQIDEARAGIALIQSGNTETKGLYSLMREAVLLAIDIADRSRVYDTAMDRQRDIEAAFAVAMGDMLKDGYWSDNNYTVGQEESLFLDAQDMMALVSQPSIKYTVSAINLAHIAGYEQERFALNQTLRLYDEQLSINDYVYISKLVEYPAEPQKDTITISNDALNIGGKTLESILGRINEIAQLIDQKNALYERARAIGADGSIPMKLLEGTIDVLKTKLTSSVSNWFTDDQGNIVLESVDGQSAMKLCGDGFMIAAGRDEQGNWDWRTFGTGKGFTADMIVAGYLSADRIEAESITVNKLSSDVGRSLDLSSNTSISLNVTETVKEMIGYRVELISDRGEVLSEYMTSLVLSAHVFSGNEDVTAQIPAGQFIWSRKSKDASADAAWALEHIGVKSITVSTADVDHSAVFECSIEI